MLIILMISAIKKYAEILIAFRLKCKFFIIFYYSEQIASDNEIKRVVYKIILIFLN